MSIDNKIVKKIANLSKINIDKDQEKNLEVELNKILTWVDELKKVDTQNVKPMLSVFNEKMIMRLDISEPLNEKKILDNAPEKKEGFFVVPKVVE